MNEFILSITGKDITAKDFRTWGGTVFAATLFDKAGVYDDETVTKQSVIDTVKKVAAHLRNKPNTCKKCRRSGQKRKLCACHANPRSKIPLI